MKNITIIILLFTISSFAQSSKEMIINNIYESFVDSTYSSYYLYEECLTLENYSNKKEKFKPFTSIISENKISQLLTKASKDTLPMKWNCNEINKAKCINDSTNQGILILQLAFSSKSYQKKIDKENKKISAKPEQERRLYYFSRPIIDNEKKYAIIEMSCLYGSSSYDMNFKCVYLLKNIDNRWTKVSETSCFGM